MLGREATVDGTFEEYRDYLTLLARLELGRRFERRFGASDIVQQTLIEAHRDGSDYRGEEGAQRVAWLRRILARNIANAVRDHRREKRDIGRELPIEQSLARSSVLIGCWSLDDGPSPSQRVMGDERAKDLARALLSLDEEDREAVILRHFEERPLAEIATELGISKHEVAKRLRTGLETLRRELRGWDSRDA